jgi:hypothetical protein
MRGLLRTWIVCVGVACTGVALAAPPAPGVAARAAHKRATQLAGTGSVQQALVVVEEGLAIAPNDLPLLSLKGAVLLKLRDYSGAFAAYQAYVGAGATGANRRDALKILDDLRPAQTTFLDITLANGPASIYLDSRTLGVFCTAAPSCDKAMLPRTYKVIAERSGFEPWTGSVTVESGQTTKLAVTLVEQPSQLTVRVEPPGAHITVDGTAYDTPGQIAAGSHRVVVSLAGHADAQRDIAAHEGKPVELEVALTPLVAVHVVPAGAALALDDKPAAVADGGIAVPPGAHVLVARARGFDDAHVAIPAERPSDYQITIKLTPVVDVPPRFTVRRRVALAAGGVGVAAAAAGVVLGLQSKHLKDDAYALCPSPSSPCAGAANADATFERGRSRAVWANLAYGAAGGAVVAAAVLWLTGAPESRVAITPRAGAVAGLDLAVRF